MEGKLSIQSRDSPPPDPSALENGGGYEQLLSIQQHQHALLLEQKDAEIAHMKVRMLAAQGKTPEQEAVMAALQTKDEECALMMAAKHKELEFLASLLQMRERQIEELQLQLSHWGSTRSRGSMSPYAQGSQGQGHLEEAVNQQVLREIQRLRLRMEELEASITEQQDRCNSLALELQRKSRHVEILEQHIRQIRSRPATWNGEGLWDKLEGIHDREGSQSSPRPRREEERARMPCDKEHKWPEPERQTPSAVDVYGSSPSPSASQALSPTQIEPYYSAIRRDAEPDARGPQSTGRQSQELLREMKRLRQQMNELEQLAAGRHNASGDSLRQSSNFGGEEAAKQEAVLSNDANQGSLSASLQESRPLTSMRLEDSLSGWEYRAQSHDPLDEAVARLVNRGRYRAWRALLCRLEQGIYLCGTRRVRVRVDDMETQLEASEDGGNTWADLTQIMTGAKSAVGHV